jgi:glycosyltransferase involved in cell wall biosynthesis
LKERRLVRQLNASGLFDATYYRSRYPDVATAGIDPTLHYVVSGAAEGRNPSAEFDTAAYVAIHPEAAQDGRNPLIHYHETGDRTGIAPPRPAQAPADILSAEMGILVEDLLPAGEGDWDEGDLPVHRPTATEGAATDHNPPHRISVVIPLYNHEAYIERTLLSVLDQTLPAHEIIVVDDGSSDGSPAITAGLAQRHRQILFWSKENGGAHTAINAGIARATGDLVAILNSDDIYHADRLAAMVQAVDSGPGVDAVVTGLDFIDGDGRAILNAWYDQGVAFHRRARDLAVSLINANFLMTTSNLLARRALFDEIGGFSPLRYAHDLDFLLRLVAKGKTIRRIDRPLLSYRQHPQNTIREDTLKVKAETAAVTAFFLHCLWDRKDRGAIDWRQAANLLAVLDHHALTTPVMMCMAYFGEHPTDTIEDNPFHGDADFRALVDRFIE